MEDCCECEIFNNNFNDIISFFMKNYGKFLKLKGTSITNLKQFKNMQNDYDVLIATIKSFEPKGQESISKIKKCKNDHSQMINDIQTKVNKSNELIEKINRHYEEIKKEMPKDNIEYEEDEEEDEKENKKNLEEMSDKEIMENDRKTIILIENLLDDPEFKKKNKKDLKELVKIKNDIKDIQNQIEVKLNNDDEMLDIIEENLDNGFVSVEKGNKRNLEKAAKDAIRRRRLEYQTGLTVAFGALGSFIPGIGNIIGAGIGMAVGGIIGYGVYRFDNHRLKKVLKKYQEENIKNEDNK